MTIKNFFLIGVKWVGNCVHSLKHSIFCHATGRYRDKNVKKEKIVKKKKKTKRKVVTKK